MLHVQEGDYNVWKKRLRLCRVNFLIFNEVQEFVAAVKREYKRIDILINNAAQTIRRPPEYFRHMSLDERLLEVARENLLYAPTFREVPLLLGPEVVGGANDSKDFNGSEAPKTGSFELDVLHAFPRDKYDAHHQQIDLRTRNSW